MGEGFRGRDEESHPGLGRKDFYSELATYPKAAQERIAALSEGLLEADVKLELAKSDVDRLAVAKELRGAGLSPKEVGFVLRHFGLPGVDQALLSGSVSGAEKKECNE